MSRNISGNYNHYKNNKYEVFCEAVDKYEYKYVLYRQLYGDKSFWIRPYDMFFEKVEIKDESGKVVKKDRFTRKGKTKSPKAYLEELINLVRSNDFIIRNSENNQEYIITSITTETNEVRVHSFSISEKTSGYLTEYELFRRMGKKSCVINNKLEVWDANNEVSEDLKLKIDGYDDAALCDLINPCSIDLRIAETGFLRTRHRIVDPESIEHASNAKDLWKSVKVHKSKKNGEDYFYLLPKQTVLTHIANRIKIPNDCAGKIEIKSTYARLSLSITSGDFCNPGYDGYFPLEITNHGNHIIQVHAKSVMAQLMIIALPGPILVEYSKKATQKNEKGFDDGIPYTFWTERSIKKLRENAGDESLIVLFNNLKKQITPQVVDDINAYKSRFDDTFLTYCQNVIHKERFKNQDNKRPDVKKILNSYIEREKRLKWLYSIRFISLVMAILSLGKLVFDIYIKVYPDWLVNFAQGNLLNQFISAVFDYRAIILYIIIFVLLKVKKPKAFCTFERIDIEKPLNDTIQIK